MAHEKPTPKDTAVMLNKYLSRRLTPIPNPDIIQRLKRAQIWNMQPAIPLRSLVEEFKHSPVSIKKINSWVEHPKEDR
jgi:hypothetical protein